MSELEQRRIVAWTSVVGAICAVLGVFGAVIVTGVQALSKLDAITFKLDQALHENTVEDSSIADHERRIRELEKKVR